MIEYIYEDTDKKNLGLICKRVKESEMQNRSIQYCSWDEKTRTLTVYFESELLQSDKDILDNIVETTGDEIEEDLVETIQIPKMQAGEISFINSKKGIVDFSVQFSRIPIVTLSIHNTTISNPYTVTVTRTGFVLDFQNDWTGTVDWIAIER